MVTNLMVVGVTVSPEEVDCAVALETQSKLLVKSSGVGNEASVGVGVTGLLGFVILIDFQYA